MAALALAVGAFLVQTRLPNAKCSAKKIMGVASQHPFKNLAAKRPSSIQAMCRGSQTPRCVALERVATTHALELDSGKRTR